MSILFKTGVTGISRADGFFGLGLCGGGLGGVFRVLPAYFGGVRVCLRALVSYFEASAFVYLGP